MKNERNLDRTINESMHERVDRLIKEVETLINDFEYETGMSITATRIRFDEGDCLKKIYFKIEYYNNEQLLVRAENEL